MTKYVYFLCGELPVLVGIRETWIMDSGGVVEYLHFWQLPAVLRSSFHCTLGSRFAKVCTNCLCDRTKNLSKHTFL